MILLGRPADFDNGEITDKGYVNQRQALACRAHLVDLLYGEATDPAIIHALADPGHPATTPNPAFDPAAPLSGHESPGSADTLGE